MEVNTDWIILAAGSGKRFRSQLAKPLQLLAGVPLLRHANALAQQFSPHPLIVVPGQHDKFTAQFTDISNRFITQQQPLGTAHAVAQALPQLPKQGQLVISYADCPLLQASDVKQLLSKFRHEKSKIGIFTFPVTKEDRYGRLHFAATGEVTGIIERNEAGYSHASNLCFAGLMVCDLAHLHASLPAILADSNSGNNREYYLTSLINAETKITTYEIKPEDAIGVDHPIALAAAESKWQTAKRNALLAAGLVRMQAPETVFFSFDTEFEGDCLIEPGVYFAPGCRIEAGVHIRAYSYLEGVICRSGAVIGPFARIRPGSELGAQVEIGSFVEVKNSVLAAGTKAHHLAYIGDADVGVGSNIGAGAITCNYDGSRKHRTRLGNNTFIGSNVALIAPITIADEAYVAAGSTISKSVPEAGLAIERGPEKVIPAWRKQRKQ